MRTTIDMPDSLSRRLKRAAADRKTTMRALIVQAVKQSLDTPAAPFRLRDAAVGHSGNPVMDAASVNQAIDSLREKEFRP
jgi:predicted transcriptional regulator